MENIGTEYIYLNLKANSKNIQKKIISSNSRKIEKDYKKIIIFPQDNSIWFYRSFKTIINIFEYPIMESEKWSQNDIEYNQNDPPLEIKNKIYKLQEKINYDKFNNIIRADILLRGESKFWVFLHAGEKFTDRTFVIIFSKIHFNKRCYVSIGTFINKKQYNNKNNKRYNINKWSLNNNIEKNILYESDSSKALSLNNNIYNIDNNLDTSNDKNIDMNIEEYNNIDNKDKTEYEFIVLKKQELVKEISLKDKKKLLKEIKGRENTLDICKLKIYIFDDGQKINIKIKLDDGHYENEIHENYFKSAFDKRNTNNIENDNNQIMFAGSGEGCAIISFNNEISNKDYKYKKTEDCKCCLII